MKMPKSFLVALGGAALGLVSLDAATLAQWDFHGITTPSSPTAVNFTAAGNTSIINTGIAVSNITSPYLQLFDTGNNIATGDLNVKPNTTSATWNSDLASALTSGKYLAFDLTLDVGYAGGFSMDSFNVIVARNGGGAPADMSVYYTFNQSASSVADYIQIGTSWNNPTTGIGSPQSHSYALGSSTAETNYIKFIILPTATGNGNLHFTNMAVNGTSNIVPVPEPSAYAMMAGIAAFGLVVLRRRKR